MTSGPPAILLMNDSLSVGGTEGQFAEVACRLDRMRWNIHVACLRAEGPLRRRLEAAQVDVWSCGRGSFKSPTFCVAVWKLARYLRKHRIQLVHCFDFYSNVLGVLAARFARVPVVIASQRDMGDVRSRSQQLAQNLVLRLASMVLVNAEAIRESLVKRKVVSADRIALVRNGTDLARFQPPATPIPTGPPFIIGTVANLRPEKGLDDLLRAVQKVSQIVPGVRCVLWGDGPCSRTLESLAAELAIDHFVTFAGHTSSVEDALRSCHVFAFPPTRNEGFSNALLEAMAVGLPVVATRCGGNEELVEDGKNGLLVPAGDSTALAGAILRVITEPTLAAGLSTRAREHVHASYSMECMVAQMEDLYAKLLGARLS